jgi:DNA repair exonuclease SbcCD ATPase subunit
MEKELSTLKKKLPSNKNIESKEDLTDELNSLKVEHKMGSKLLNEANAIKVDISKNDKLLNKIRDEINEHKDNKPKITLEKYESKMKNTDIEIKNLMKENQKDTDIINNYNLYEMYLEYLKNCKDWNKRLNNFNSIYEKSKFRYSALLKIKEKSYEAEMLALENTITNINIHAKHYLDMMFEDNPIIVQLENCKKDSKNNIKLKMNLSILYKGSVYDSIDQLSGGESDRISLAFILAINEMMNSPILMLDECLASLDGETNTDIFELLRDIANNKLILVVSHEATRGIFDNIITIE